MFNPRDYLPHIVADSRVVDLIPWLAGAFAFLMACELVYEATVWVRGLRGRPSLHRYRRGAEVPTVAIGQADQVGGVR